MQSAQALAAAHAANIIHRDIKPENVMIRKDGIVKVLDFGLAKLVEAAPLDKEADTRNLGLTQAGTVMGTVAYMSPEQARGNAVDVRTDIFSLGVMLYEMIAGRQPFRGETINHVIVAILEQEPPPLAPEVPAELDRILKQALAKRVEERYPNAQALLADLKRVQTRWLVEAENKRDSTDNERAEAHTMTLDQRSSALDKARATASGSALPTSSDKPKTKKWWLVALIVLLAGIGGYLGYRSFAPTTRQIESIAVMPFVNEGGNQDVEYLSDGMTETLISSLSQLPSLNVKPRSSVFRYKGKEVTPQTIASELNVEAILNGRVVQRGQDLSLFIELIDVSLDKVVWSQQYNRRQTDLVTLQTDIARDVSSRLKTRLSGADESKVTKTYTTNPEAYQLYLKGKYYSSKYNESGYKKGLEYFQKAVEIDPTYALAYCGIAGAYDTANDYYLPPREAQPLVKAAAAKAVELDGSLAEAHSILGRIAFWYEWDWSTAEREMKRAMEIDPSLTLYPVYLSAMGRHEEAIKSQELAQQRLPLDLQMSMDMQGVYLFAGRFDQVIDLARKTIELDQNYWGAYQELGLAYERKKQYPEAIAALEKARSLDNNPSILGYLGFVYAAAGKRAEAERVLNELKRLSTERHVPPYSIAIIYSGLNDKDQAFEWLNKAYEARSIFLSLIKVETVVDNLRSDPRFKELLKRMNLPL